MKHEDPAETFIYKKAKTQPIKSKETDNMAFNKKAQLTMFIILGAVLVIMVGVLIYSAMTKTQAEKAVSVSESAEFPAELKPVGVFVQTCLEQEAEKTINKTALQGGRPLAPRHPYSWENKTLSHGYYLGVNEMPTLEEMQNEMAGYLKLNLNGCINSLNDFKGRGMDIEYGNFEPRFTVMPDSVIVDMEFPITLKKDTGEVRIEKFSAEIPSRLGYLHDAAYKTTEKEISGGASFFFMSEFDMKIDIYLTNTSNMVFYTRTLDKNPLFIFVNTYKEENVTAAAGLEEQNLGLNEEEEAL
ncbi:hypothetical protein COV19_02970 [Candidatus Woesearchaeota archaeon CG10_big_fil_rev_8_21_14_0_10_44_13]|nr:MAG: hypothetical protein COV19_02970 [Candidatus Woesearchaeota archaeon CG10_big_fil_rev_8_21_14_0_10_44_13]